MQCKFMPGDRLVVVRDALPRLSPYWIRKGYSIPFKKNELVTCRAILEIPNEPKILNVLLEEYRSGLTFKGAEMGWAHFRFEKAKDISIFHEIAQRATRKDKEKV